MPVSLKLITTTTTTGSADRVDKLCQLLGENIIGGVWVYAPRESAAIGASMDILGILVQALGIGSARYLKVSW